MNMDYGASQLLAPINNYCICLYSPYTYVHIVQKRASMPIPRPCHAHKVDTSPAFHQYHAEEIGFTTTIIFNWDVTLLRMQNSNTSDAIMEFLDSVYSSSDKKQSTIAVYLDFSNALDTVNHET